MGQNNVLQSVSKTGSDKKEALKICDAILIEPFVLKFFLIIPKTGLSISSLFLIRLRAIIKNIIPLPYLKNLLYPMANCGGVKILTSNFIRLMFIKSFALPADDELTEHLIVL